MEFVSIHVDSNSTEAKLLLASLKMIANTHYCISIELPTCRVAAQASSLHRLVNRLYNAMLNV